jgi:DNA repair protein RecO (recombination protein O)
MEWSDDAIVLSVRPLGEASAVLSVLTRSHGRHAGLARGASGRRGRGMLQPGNRLSIRWRARLADQLGTVTCELSQAVAPGVLGDRQRLAGIAAACAIAETALPEREPQPLVFAAFCEVIDAVEYAADWPARYVRWELALLAELGYGLDLSRCALTGVTHGLAWVSPRTGRAVTAEAGAPWRDRLLPLPAFLFAPDAPAGPLSVAEGLALTAHFLDSCIYAERGARLPAARARLASMLAPPACAP